MRFDAIIFDMDGTIVDTEKIWSRVSFLLLERRGVVCDEDLKACLFPQIQGLAIHESCRVIKEVTGIEDEVHTLIHEKSSIADELYREGSIEFIPGFESFFAHVKELGLKTAIATNAGDTTLELTDAALNLQQYFGKHMYAISCVGNTCKPQPDIYLYAAKQIGCDPKRCIAIEDSAHGVNAAKRAGMFCIGLNSSGDVRQVEKADLIVDHYYEIPLKKLLGIEGESV